jgi:hypothetical protein
VKTKKFRIFAPIEGEKEGCSFGKTRIVEPKGHDSRKIHDEDGTLKLIVTEKEHFRIDMHVRLAG